MNLNESITKVSLFFFRKHKLPRKVFKISIWSFILLCLFALFGFIAPEGSIFQMAMFTICILFLNATYLLLIIAGIIELIQQFKS